MRMWRTDGRAAYLLLMLLSGLRSAGVREPRRLYPPSPPPRIGNDLGFGATPCPAPSPLITLTAGICPPRHPHRLNKPAGFWSSSSSSSSPQFPPITLLNILYVFALSPPPPPSRCFTVVFWSRASSSPAPEVLFRVKTLRENRTASAHVYPESDALEGGESIGGRAAGARLVLRCARLDHVQ